MPAHELPKVARHKRGTFFRFHRLIVEAINSRWRNKMGRGLLLWLIGIPLPIILVIWLLGGLN
jgi:hypothetical protein